ncbi:MAG: V-type ATP synthase subunit F [Lentisphaerae bacterium ADurb.BinA184]|nr:MAG: V-type ATP synthase subunit F [Lentisphaerae bacterium ADurb.BinA184]
MSYRIIGDQDTILGYAFAGVPGVAVDGEEQARAAFRSALADAGVSMLIVTRRVASLLSDEIAAHRVACQAPFVVEVGDLWDTPVKRRTLEELIQEAVGIRITKAD